MKSPVKFGKYYLLERINVGGMAEVFKAKSFGEAGFERLVAVKRILPSIAEDQEFISMFIDEAKLAVQLTHPNIAQIFELGKVGEAYFIALEYVPGKDLRSMYDRARKRADPLPIPMACYMTMKICEGLDYAHNKKDAAGRNLELVHRDVSPQNMLISWDGDVKLIDFGIAKAASKSSKTQAGILKGKFGYMSPEQVRGLQIDRRSDIFSVGIVLYELLTMERLFVGESDFSTLEKVRNVEIMPPSTYNRKIPEELEQIVLKALAKHPEDRYRTSMDLHDDLQSFMYTSGNFFARKDLSAFMHKVFQDEIAKEASKDDEYRKFDSRRASDLEVFEGATAPPATLPPGVVSRNAPPPPPPPQRVSVPPPPPPAPARAAQKKTMMGGLSPVGAPPTPSPAQRTTLMGAGNSPAASASLAPAPPPPPRPSMPTPAVAPAPQPGLDMDWDDEELATQVYDRPEGGFPGLPSSPPGSVNGHSSPAAGVSLRAPTPAPNPAALASTRAPTVPMMQAGVPAPKSLPAIPAPPSFSTPAVGAPMPPSMSQPSVPMPQYGRQMPGPGGVYREQPAPERRRSVGTIVFALVGVIAVGAGVAVALRVFRGEPTGTLEITTNVPGATVSIDGQPQPGNGTRFTVNRLAATAPHRVTVQRDGFLRFQQDVPVRSGEVTPMQIALLPDPTSIVAPVPQPVIPPPTPVVQPTIAPTSAVAQNTPRTAVEPVVAPTAAADAGTTTTAAANPPPDQDQHPVAATSNDGAHTQPAPRRTNNNTRRTASNSNSAPQHTARTSNTDNSNSTAAPASGGGGSGFLSLSTRPASRCTVAGQTFSTPRLRLELPSGTHRVSCQNTDFNVTANFTVTIRGGQETREISHPLN